MEKEREIAGSSARVRAGVPGDAPACAAIFNDWVDATGWMPRVHPPEEVAHFYREQVMATTSVLVAETAAGVRGFLSLDGEGRVAGFHLAPEARGRGIGHALLAAAKARRPEGLTLWTFLANDGARRFYAREGFREVRRTGGDNEEGMPDVLLEWRPA